MPMQDSESPQKSASDDVYITPFPFLALRHPILYDANADSESSQNSASNNIYITPFLFLALLHPILCNADA